MTRTPTHKASNCEIERLRQEQIERAIPLIGQLLDAWDGVQSDAKQQITELAPGVVRNILALNSAIEM